MQGWQNETPECRHDVLLLLSEPLGTTSSFPIITHTEIAMYNHCPSDTYLILCDGAASLDVAHCLETPSRIPLCVDLYAIADE